MAAQSCLQSRGAHAIGVKRSALNRREQKRKGWQILKQRGTHKPPRIKPTSDANAEAQPRRDTSPAAPKHIPPPTNNTSKKEKKRSGAPQDHSKRGSANGD